jgi:hypothetical protein
MWSDSGDNALRLRANGGTPVAITSDGHFYTPQLRGGAGDAGTLRAWGAGSSVNFRWDGNLHFRVDEALERTIATANFEGVGSYILATDIGFPVIPPNGTVAGSRFGRAGTWRSLTNFDVGGSMLGLFVRIS